MSLSFEDIWRLIASLPDSEKVTLVGGQALNFWAEMYLHDQPEFYQKYAPFTSADIDFFGTRKAVLRCAEVWDGMAELPEPFDPSPNSGVVIVPLRQEADIVIDFLVSVHGISNADLLRERVRIHYKDAEFFVIHPLHCLQSRISNVVSLHRDGADSLNRLMIATAVMERRIRHLLDAGQRRQALKEIEAIFRISANPMSGIPLFTKYGTDLFRAIPEDSRLGEAFVRRRYPQMREFLDRKRKKQGKYPQKSLNSGG